MRRWWLPVKDTDLGSMRCRDPDLSAHGQCFAGELFLAQTMGQISGGTAATAPLECCMLLAMLGSGKAPSLMPQHQIRLPFSCMGLSPRGMRTQRARQHSTIRHQR